MQLAKLSSFISYDLTDLEYRAAHTYNEAQLAGLQNQLAAAAEEMLKAPLDGDDTSIESIKKRAYLRGQVDSLKYLLSLHDSINSPEKTKEGNEQ